MNISLAKKIIDELFTLGVREYVICPGGRNAPFVEVLGKVRGLKTYHFFEERSASFFALGRIKDLGEPVAVVTTSGTAVAECLPAVIEGFYSGLPLVIISADRPQKYRGTGAPQVIEQVDLFREYSKSTQDISTAKGLQISWQKKKPMHLNVCFDEPLIDEQVEPFRPAGKPLRKAVTKTARFAALDLDSIEQFLKISRRPLVLLSGLTRDQRKAVVPWLTKMNLPVYAEAGSHLRDDPELVSQVIRSGEKLLSHSVLRKSVDGVIRIGSVPTTRFWRDLEDAAKHLPLLSFSHLPWSGLARDKRQPLALDLLASDVLLNAKFAWTTAELQEVWDFDQKQASRLDHLVEKYPLSEVALVRGISKSIPSGARVYLGNSLPIREWDLAAGFQFQDFEYQANRGANGIDGQLSTFLGWMSPETSNWALVGDLTAFYDLVAPWNLAQLKPSEFHVVIINNGGGKIFAPMFKNSDFENRHQRSFAPWAEQFGLSYGVIEDAQHLRLLTENPPQVIEVRPDAKSSDKFLDLWNKSWLKP